jgi:hypothetical protein
VAPLAAAAAASGTRNFAMIKSQISEKYEAFLFGVHKRMQKNLSDCEKRNKVGLN